MVLRGGAALQAGNIGTASGPTGVNQLNAESASSNASLLLRVDASTIAVGQTIELFDPSGNSIFSTTTASDGSGGVQGLSGDYLTITLDSAAMTALSALGDGNHTLRVDMADVFQNTASATITLEQATTLPTLTVDDTVLNENSPGSISDDSVQITGTSTDANYILVTIADDGVGSSPNTATYRVNPDSSGDWTLDLDTATPTGGTATTVDQNDTFSITASAHGDLNNTGTTATSTDFIVSGPGPQFADPVTLANVEGTGSDKMTNLHIGDFNGDGAMDYATSYGDNTNEMVMRLKDNGTPGTTDYTALNFYSQNGDRIERSAVGDANGDGIDDIMYVDIDGYLTLAEGDGTTIRSFLGDLPRVDIDTMLMFDFDGDGDLDLVFGSDYTGSYSELNIYENDGAGNFNSLTGVDSDNATVTDIKRADFNDDGKDDLIVNVNSANKANFVVMSGEDSQGNPTFNTYEFSTTPTSFKMEVGLLDDNDQEDVIWTDDGTFIIYYDMGANGLAASSSEFIYSDGAMDPIDVEIMDYDGDGNNDILVAYQHSSSESSVDLEVFLTNDSGWVTGSQVLLDSSYTNYYTLDLIDYNSDGIEDIFIGGTTQNSETVLIRGGANLQAGNIGTSGGPAGTNQLNAESLTSNASLVMWVDPATIAIGHTVKLFDPSGTQIFTTTLQNDGSGGVQGLSGDYLTVTLDSAAMTALSKLGDGNHALRVEMADAFNNGASTGITIEQASTLPTITVTDTILGENSAGSITDDSVQITGTSSDANYILVTVADDGGGSSANTATYKVTPDSTGTWTLDLDTATPQGGNAITTDNGDTFSVTASAHGTLNNTGTTATANDYIVDLFAPTLMPYYASDHYYEFDWPITGGVYDGMVFGDANGDGNLDLMTQSSSNSKASSIFYGMEGGLLDATEHQVLTTNDSHRSLHMVDLDGNGFDDLVAFDDHSVFTVMAKNDGSGLDSSTKYEYYLGSDGTFQNNSGAIVNTGDFNGDGHMDFGIMSTTSDDYGGYYLFMGDGAGGIQSYQHIAERSASSRNRYIGSSYQMKDINQDGYSDLIYNSRDTSSPNDSRILVTYGQNSSTSPLQQGYSLTFNTNQNEGVGDLQLADMDGDGWEDLVVFIEEDSSGGDIDELRIYHNTQSTGNSSFNSSNYTAIHMDTIFGADIQEVLDVDLIDVDGDGDMDIFLGLQRGNIWQDFAILTQESDGSFSVNDYATYDRIYTGSMLGQRHQYYDFNGDGILDYFRGMRDQDGQGTYGFDPRFHWGRIATVTGDVINQDNEILTVALGDATAAGDTLVVTYNGNQIGTATTTATDISNGSMDITLNNVENLYNGGRNQLTFTISDALGGTNTYLQSMEVATNSAASNSYILHFDGEADTLTSFTAGDGAGGDKMNISQLLTDAGYTGAIDWTTLESGGYISRTDDGSGNTIISVDKDGTAGTTHDLQHIVTLNNVTSTDLDDDDIE